MFFVLLFLWSWISIIVYLLDGENYLHQKDFNNNLFIKWENYLLQKD